MSSECVLSGYLASSRNSVTVEINYYVHEFQQKGTGGGVKKIAVALSQRPTVSPGVQTLLIVKKDCSNDCPITGLYTSLPPCIS